MTSFVIAFDRTLGRSLSLEEFTDPAAAIRCRLAAEVNHVGEDVEVVLLSALNRAALQRSHSRYFDSDSSSGAGALSRDVAHLVSESPA